MPPTDRFVISFAAEPPQESLPYGRWADTLREYFLAACQRDRFRGRGPGRTWRDLMVSGSDLQRAGRSCPPWRGRASGYELFGFVCFSEASGAGPTDFEARADFTAELAEVNPDWKLDLNDDVVGSWRGEQGKRADMTLVWGVPKVPGGAVVTAELANLAVDQCELIDERFTLLAADNYRGDYLEVKLWDKRGQELAAESLYVEDDEGQDEHGPDDGAASAT